MIRNVLAMLSAAVLAVAPAVASAAPAAPAAGLSLAPNARAVSTSDHRDKLAGGTTAIVALAVLGGIAAILAVGLSNDGDDNGRPASR